MARFSLGRGLVRIDKPAMHLPCNAINHVSRAGWLARWLIYQLCWLDRVLPASESDQQDGQKFSMGGWCHHIGTLLNWGGMP